MTTKTIGIKEFRANISEFARKAQEGNVKYVVMNRTKPLFEIKAFSKEKGLEEVFAEIMEGKKDIEKGKLYTEEEIMKEFLD